MPNLSASTLHSPKGFCRINRDLAMLWGTEYAGMIIFRDPDHDSAQLLPRGSQIAGRGAGRLSATAASQRPVLSGILLGLCWIWDTCGSILTRLRRWRGTAESRWTWRRFARLIPSGGN